MLYPVDAAGRTICIYIQFMPKSRIRQSTAPQSFHLPECICGSLRQASRAITHFYDQRLRPAGLTAMQFQILMTIRTLTQATSKELVTVLTIDQTTLTRSLALLVSHGWLKAGPRADRRSKAFELTSEGVAVVERALPLWTEVQNSALDKLEESDWRVTREVLRALIGFSMEHSGNRRDKTVDS